MGINTLNDLPANKIAESSDSNQYKTALDGDLVPRVDGVPTAGGGRLGTPLYPWAGANFEVGAVISDGENSFTIADVATSTRDGVNSGEVVSADSGFPNYVKTNGTNQITIAGASTALNIVVNAEAVSITSDITISSGFTSLGAVGATCLINEVGLSGQLQSKYLGEKGYINVDAVGSLWSGLSNGDLVAFEVNGELSIGNFDTVNNRLYNCKRGWFMKASDTPAYAEAISDNDTITRYNLGYLLLDADGTTTEIIYKPPFIGGNQPSSPAVGDYWYDTTTNQLKRWNGSSFANESKVFIAHIAIDTTGNVVGVRNVDFSKNYVNSFDGVDIKTSIENDNYIVSIPKSNISIYGNIYSFREGIGHLNFDKTDTNVLPSPAANTTYIAYIAHNGKLHLDEVIPHWRDDLRGFYHPFNAWRAVGAITTDATPNFDSEPFWFSSRMIGYATLTNSSISAKLYDFLFSPLNARDLSITMVLAGGGGGGNSGGGVANSGGSSTAFGLATATGGGGASNVVGVGGTGSTTAEFGTIINGVGGTTSTGGNGGINFITLYETFIFTSGQLGNGSSGTTAPGGSYGGGGGGLSGSRGGGGGGCVYFKDYYSSASTGSIQLGEGGVLEDVNSASGGGGGYRYYIEKIDLKR